MKLLDLNIRWLGNILECQYNFSYVVIAKVPIGIRAKYPLAFWQSTFWHLGSFFQSGFSFTNIDDSQDRMGRGTLSL